MQGGREKRKRREKRYIDIRSYREKEREREGERVNKRNKNREIVRMTMREK